VTLDYGPKGGGRRRIRKLPFDTPEPGGRSGPRTLDQRAIREKISDIGGKTRHRSSRWNSRPLYQNGPIISLCTICA
jgi:hypothetical protein